jgi:regulator of RNase E activity RraA
MAAPGPVSAETLAKLAKITSPTVCNAIETFKLRDHADGFMGPEIRSILPQLGTMVGYAATALIGARTPSGTSRVTMVDLWKHVSSLPEPRILVIQDLDFPRPHGSFWGEVNANIFKAQGAIGTITDGGVRDLDEVARLGFHFFASCVLVSHAHVHVIDVGQPVEVGGLRVKPGDLLHADQHGVASIPLEIADRIPDAARRIEEGERKIIELCQKPGFSTEKLIELFRGYQ